MTRTLLATAAALAAATTLFGSAANACISCEYVPEVVRNSQTSNPAPSVKARSYAEPERARPSKRNLVKRAPPKSEPAAKKVDTAATAPAKQDAQNESSSISVAAAAPASEPAKAKTKTARNESSSISSTAAVSEPAKTETKIARNESSSISVASTEIAAPAKTAVAETEAAAKPADCKKFFPSAGLTLTVPCE